MSDISYIVNVVQKARGGKLWRWCGVMIRKREHIPGTINQFLINNFDAELRPPEGVR